MSVLSRRRSTGASSFRSASSRSQYHSPERLSHRGSTSQRSLGSGPQHLHLHPLDESPSFVFVCLGVGGGPLEGDCSCYLLKPADTTWDEGTIVVEGGSWLGGLTRVLERDGPTSAFHDFDFPYDLSSPALRAGLIGSFTKSFLISHAHLDHILGLVLGSASLPGKRSVYGLKATLENIMDLFNGKIWPKLASWKEDEPHTVYHLRSLEAQSMASLDASLSVLPFSLSHGLNPSVPPAPPTPTPSYRNSYFSKRYSLPLSNSLNPQAFFRMGSESVERRPSNEKTFLALNGIVPYFPPSSPSERPIFTSPFAPSSSTAPPDYQSADSTADGLGELRLAPRETLDKSTGQIVSVPPGHTPIGVSATVGRSSRGNARRPRTAQGSERAESKSNPNSTSGSGLSTSAWPPGKASDPPPRRLSVEKSPPALDSTAFFITHKRTRKEVLFFGDVEPDCISRFPRNHKVWQHAARRIAEGRLHAIFLECSFPASHPTEFLYGHLSVPHLYQELRTLARFVVLERRAQERLRRASASGPSSGTGAGGNGNANNAALNGHAPGVNSNGLRGESGYLAIPPCRSTLARSSSYSGVQPADLKNALKGLSVVIIHVKTAFFPSYATIPSRSRENSSEAGENLAADPSAEQVEDVEPPARAIDPRSMQERILMELRELEDEERDPPSHLTHPAPQADASASSEEKEEKEPHIRLGVRYEMAEQGMRIEC